MVILLEIQINMRKLFTFGDSFTFNKKHENCNYSQKYRKNGDDYWPDIVANELGIELHNYGYGALSNDRIIDTIIEKIDLITENDIVIIGKSFYNRFDIPSNKNNVKSEIMYKFRTINPFSFDLLIQEGFTKQEANSISFYGYQYDNAAFVERQNLRFDFIKKYLKNKKIDKLVFWEVEKLWKVYENIKTCTNGEIEDLHWSYKGHREFSKVIIDKIYHDTTPAVNAKLI